MTDKNEVDYIELGKHIREFRKKRNLSQEMLASLVNLTPSAVGRIEEGERKITLAEFVGIANVLAVSAEELLYRRTAPEVQMSVPEIQEMLADCDSAELKAILEILQSAKKVIRKPRVVAGKTE